MAIRKLRSGFVQPTLWGAVTHAGVGHRGYSWGPLEDARLHSDGIVPVEVEHRGRRETALVCRLGTHGSGETVRDPVAARVEVQTFEEVGFPLLSLTIGMGKVPNPSEIRVGLLFNYEDEVERRLFEGLARQARIRMFLLDSDGRAKGEREIPLTLWNRVQVYQALEAAERIWIRTRGNRAPFVLARAHWEARQEAALSSDAPSSDLARGDAQDSGPG